MGENADHERRVQSHILINVTVRRVVYQSSDILHSNISSHVMTFNTNIHILEMFETFLGNHLHTRHSVDSFKIETHPSLIKVSYSPNGSSVRVTQHVSIEISKSRGAPTLAAT